MMTISGQVACKPTERDFKPEIKQVSGFATMEQITTLVSLDVMLPSDSGYNVGDKIFIKADYFDNNRKTFANVIYKVGKKKLILVPEDAIVLVSKSKIIKPTPTPTV